MSHRHDPGGSQAEEAGERKEWQEVAALQNADVWLTPDEARAVTAALGTALEPFHDRTLRNRPDSTRRVRVMTMVTPQRTATS